MYQFANSFIPVRDSWVNERNLSMVERDSEYSMSAKSWLIYSGRRTPVIMALTLGFSITDDLAKEAKEGQLDRREFLAMATAFGATTATAYGLLGVAAPKVASAAANKGGILKISMS
mgnify:CR=1 FL=1